MLDVEVALNDRPLSYVEDDVQLPVLTPCAMMFGQPRLVPEESAEEGDADYQQKKRMAKVSDLYRERIRSIKTVLFFIVSVSLLSGETVPTTERLSITFTLNGKREFVPGGQVSSLLVVYCSLFLHLN